MPPRPLRIVHCFRSPVGGIFRHVRDLAEAHAAAGHEIGIVCDSSTGGELEERYFESIADFLALGVYKVRMQRHIGPGDLGAAWRTYGAIRRMAPDILHGHGSKGGAYARLFGTVMRARGQKVARLYSPHGGVLHYDRNLMGRGLFFLERRMDHLTDHMIFVSKYEEDMFEAKIGRPRAPTTIVYNGLRAGEFEDVVVAPQAADFLYIGMMRDLKGPDIFIDALAQASKIASRPVSAVMVGAGDDLPKYRHQADRLGLTAQVTFRDPMPARQAFALARNIVVPSRAESMPYIVLEALAAGKPMIATAVGGIPEIFAGRTDLLIRPDPAQMAARMGEVLADEAGYAQRMPPREELRQRFGADVMAGEIEAIYRQYA
ncbi:glycosyltransferase [Chelativorans sp. ZYF759]|uniref:glycosyltransferase family 4 protein n=1 Tax=Chelativorans sp. ZYF759 TaxID=2692213 RepID=UPI00145E67B3|nr:glycosyltransferase [Chelativorans sp. ZYF759]